MRLIFKIILCFVLLFSVASAMAQSTINGIIKNSKGKVVSSATITLKTKEGKIAGFTRSNEKGRYELKSSQAISAGWTIEVSNLGYAKAVLTITDPKISYDFSLNDTAIELPTVVIKNAPRLRLQGDTLSYRLSDFSGNQDRVLGDVLKKMPGIEVAANGKISYNGKNISNFYIDGDNLLDDKYNIATKSIPKGAVDQVQVIENDQPIKMLRNKMNSDDVALNITIKNDAKLKLMGQINAGAGLPHHFSENSNAMMFNKKYKGINYIKGNNIGDDPADDLISHNRSDYLKRLDNNKPDELLSTGAAGVPDLPQKRYLFNQAALLNVNNLFNLRKDVQLKTNIYYMYDKQQRDYNKFTEIYLPTGNISFSEKQENTSRPDLLHAQANLNINRENSYLNNTFITDYNPIKYKSDLISNGVPFRQNLSQKPLDISNEFNYMNTLKSGTIYSLYSYLNYSNQSEKLLINSGLNEAQFNDGIPYSHLLQQTSLPSYYTNNYFTFKRASPLFVQTYKAGLSLQAQQLSSSLDAIQSDQSSKAASVEGSNNLNWKRSNVYLEGLYEYTGENLKASLTLPINYQNIHYDDPGFNLNKKLDRFYLNPQFNLKYQIAVENSLAFSYALRNELGGMDDIYRGAILENYRSLFANNAPISERRNQTAALAFNYKQAITMFFFGLRGSYSRINLNTISSSIITDNLQQRIVLQYDNNVDIYNLSGNISKYLFALRTTLSAGINWSQTTSNQIQNNELLPYKAISNGVKAGFQSKISNAVNLNYSVNYTLTESKTAVIANQSTKYNQMRQEAELSVMFLKGLFLNLSAEHLYTKQSGQNRLNYLFSDMTLRYKVVKINTDFEFGVNNIANIKNYSAVYLSSNAFTSGTYQIPGRIAMFKVSFNF